MKKIYTQVPLIIVVLNALIYRFFQIYSNNNNRTPRPISKLIIIIIFFLVNEKLWYSIKLKGSNQIINETHRTREITTVNTNVEN